MKGLVERERDRLDLFWKGSVGEMFFTDKSCHFLRV